MRKITLYTLLPFVLLMTPHVNADELERLFFTAEERTQLNNNYRRLALPVSGDGGIVLNGIVQKHGGKRTAWVNGVAQPADNSDEHHPESYPVSIPGQSKTVKIKVGQKVFIDPTDSGK